MDSLTFLMVLAYAVVAYGLLTKPKLNNPLIEEF
jgi:hypothetical protein